jgi:hypothetical protein
MLMTSVQAQRDGRSAETVTLPVLVAVLGTIGGILVVGVGTIRRIATPPSIPHGILKGRRQPGRLTGPRQLWLGAVQEDHRNQSAETVGARRAEVSRGGADPDPAAW